MSFLKKLKVRNGFEWNSKKQLSISKVKRSFGPSFMRSDQSWSSSNCLLKTQQLDRATIQAVMFAFNL